MQRRAWATQAATSSVLQQRCCRSGSLEKRRYSKNKTIWVGQARMAKGNCAKSTGWETPHDIGRRNHVRLRKTNEPSSLSLDEGPAEVSVPSSLQSNKLPITVPSGEVNPPPSGQENASENAKTICGSMTATKALEWLCFDEAINCCDVLLDERNGWSKKCTCLPSQWHIYDKRTKSRTNISWSHKHQSFCCIRSYFVVLAFDWSMLW